MGVADGVLVPVHVGYRYRWGAGVCGGGGGLMSAKIDIHKYYIYNNADIDAGPSFLGNLDAQSAQLAHVTAGRLTRGAFARTVTQPSSQ
jgi:hypothetical protein